MEDLVMMSFWRGRRVLVTGHTGFKGSWLTIWLHSLGARVTGLSLPPKTRPSLFEDACVETLCESRIGDICDCDCVAAAFAHADPEFVFHLAAQPLVRVSYGAPVETFRTNVLGTVHVLEALRSCRRVRSAVMVTSDKVYRNNDSGYAFIESDPLGGHDPYSASKAACELAVASFRDSFLSPAGVAVSSARAGNVIGGGDWAEDRLVPDAVRAWQVGRTLDVRNPRSTRPWQHVLESLWGYLTLAQRTAEDPSVAGAYNFGPDPTGLVPVSVVVELLQLAMLGTGGARPEARSIGRAQGPHEAAALALDSSLAARKLGVRPSLTLQQAVVRTANWYRRHAAGEPALELCLEDIRHYEDINAPVRS